MFPAGQLAEGKLCFTSTTRPSTEFEAIESDGEYEVQKEMEGEEDGDKGFDEDLQIIDEMEGEVARPQVSVVGRNKSKVGASRANRKSSPKKKSADGIVGVMERFVQIKEKEVNK